MRCSVLQALGVGSKVIGVLHVLVGVGWFDPDHTGSLKSTLTLGESEQPGESLPRFEDSLASPKWNWSNSGVRRGTIAFHVFVDRGEDLGEAGDEADGEYFSTILVHRWNTGSGIWSFQFTAFKNALSFMLISQAFRPEILLQARAEKLRS